MRAEEDPFPSSPARFLFFLSLALSKTQRGFRLRRTELIHIHSIQILSKITEKQSLTERLTTFKISPSMFSTIDEIFHKHTISFQQTVTILSLSNYHSPGADPHQPHRNTPKILLTFQKIFISSYQILRETSFTDLQQTYQSTSNITPRLPLYTSQRTLKNTTLLHYSNIPNTKVKKPSHARST